MRTLTFVFSLSLWFVAMVYVRQIPWPLEFLLGNAVFAWCLLNCLQLALAGYLDHRRVRRAWLTSQPVSSVPPQRQP